MRTRGSFLSGFFLETKPEDLHQKGPASKVPPGFQGAAYTARDEGITLPTVTREVSPGYTVEAMRAKKYGAVIVGAIVQPDGRVGDTVVAVSLDRQYGLDAQALAAVKQWLFEPGTLRGAPVPVAVSVQVDFNLSGGPPGSEDEYAYLRAGERNVYHRKDCARLSGWRRVKLNKLGSDYRPCAICKPPAQR